MQSFNDSLRWYINTNVAPNLEAMRIRIRFYQGKGVHMLKPGCSLPNLVNNCLHNSTTAKFYPFLERKKDLREKVREDYVGGPSIVFNRKAVVGETKNRSPPNFFKSIVGIDASQLYPHAMCQPMPTGLYKRWDFDVDLQRFKPRSNKARPFGHTVAAYFQNSRRNYKIGIFRTTGTQKKMNILALMVFVVTVTHFLRLWFAFINLVSVRKCNLVSPMKKFTEVRKKLMVNLRRPYLRESVLLERVRTLGIS